MQAGSLVASDAMYPTSRVVVSGVAREAVSWSVGRELAGDLPAQVAAVSGVVQASGSITWNEAYDVDEMPTTPFNESSGWLPRRGNRVEIYAGDGVSEWRVFTGLVDSSSGSVGEAFQSKIIDDRDRLNVPFTHDPMLRVMPPLVRGAADYRGAGLTYLYYVDLALRRSGFFVTPPSEARQAVSVPAQSSMWPEVGVMTAGVVGGQAGSGAWCSPHNSVDGLSVSNVLNTYLPNVKLPYGELFRLSMTVDPGHSGNASVTGYYADLNYVSLAVAGSRTVVARLNGVEVCSLAMGAAVRVSLVIEGNLWELRTNTGGSATGSASAPSASVLDRVVVSADPASRVAGFHACYPATSTRWDYTNFAPTVRFRMDSVHIFTVLDAAPAIVEGTCFDLLEKISQATLSAMWIDEHGVFNWGPSLTLASSLPVRELTTADDVLSMPWEDNLLGTRSKVVVKYRVPAVSVSLWDNVLWHQGGAETLESSQSKTDFLSPEADEDWVGPAPSLQVLGDPGVSGVSNAGQGALTGAVLTDGTDEAFGDPYLTASLSKVNTNTYKLKHTVGVLPAGKKLELRYPSESSTIWKRWLKQSFPLVRGFAKTKWADAERVGVPAGPSWAPVLEHDAEPWLSREDSADSVVIGRLADYLAAQTGTSLPTVGGMGITPDPRLQLGDLVTIRSDKYVGAIFTAIVTGISLGAGDSFTQEISVRLTSLEATFESYDEWDSQYAGVLTYDQWASLTSMTYTEFALSKD